MPKERIVSASEFKAKALSILQDVSEGHISVRVTKRGKPIAVVSRAETGASKENVPGQLAGTIEFRGDVVGPLGDDDWIASK